MKLTTLFLTLFLFLTGCFGTGGSRVIKSEAGLNIPEWGVAIDAIYDKRLDNLIPGYKLVNVVITNRGKFGTIYLDPRKDKWTIVDNVGKSHRAINHLRFVDEQLWVKLPQELKSRLDYPRGVRGGNTTKIDLFFPASVDITNFRELAWRSTHFKKLFLVQTPIESNLKLSEKEKQIPPHTHSYRQSLKKYETEELEKKFDEYLEKKRKEAEQNGVSNNDASSADKAAPQFDPTLDDFSIVMD